MFACGSGASLGAGLGAIGMDLGDVLRGMVAENCTAGEVPGGAIEGTEGRGELFAFEGPERGGELGVFVESKAEG